VRPARSISRKNANCTFVADGRGLDGIALPHHGHERDDAIVGKIDLVDALALFLQDRALLQHHFLEVRREQRVIGGGQCRQQQVALAHLEAIQLHLRPLFRAGHRTHHIALRHAPSLPAP
jgi:hypothetical protein